MQLRAGLQGHASASGSAQSSAAHQLVPHLGTAARGGRRCCGEQDFAHPSSAPAGQLHPRRRSKSSLTLRIGRSRRRPPPSSKRASRCHLRPRSSSSPSWSPHPCPRGASAIWRAWTSELNTPACGSTASFDPSPAPARLPAKASYCGACALAARAACASAVEGRGGKAQLQPAHDAVVLLRRQHVHVVGLKPAKPGGQHQAHARRPPPRRRPALEALFKRLASACSTQQAQAMRPCRHRRCDTVTQGGANPHRASPHRPASCSSRR